jgi:hypothetical protein
VLEEGGNKGGRKYATVYEMLLIPGALTLVETENT